MASSYAPEPAAPQDAPACPTDYTGKVQGQRQAGVLTSSGAPEPAALHQAAPQHAPGMLGRPGATIQGHSARLLTSRQHP